MGFERCYGCMNQLHKPGEVCPHCGYDNANDPATEPAYVLRCGTTLNGKYIVGRTLGHGGFGITYIGYDSTLARRVCIKEYYPEGAAVRNAEQSSDIIWSSTESAQELKKSRESFVREAQKAVKLRELDAIVSVWDVFFANETAYIVMDYINGITVKGWLQAQKRTLEEKECFQMFEPIMLNLGEIHARGIIHRDISPDNIMLRKNQEPVLLDLGAAKDLRDEQGKSAFVIAKHGFTPLEQYSQKGNIGPWTDVYAMCATIYYCMTGKLPPTPMDRKSGTPMDMSSFSPAMRAVLNKGLAIEYEKRIQSMEKLSAMLRAAIFPKKQWPKMMLSLAGVVGTLAAVMLLFYWIPSEKRAMIPERVETETADVEFGAEEMYRHGLEYELGNNRDQDYKAAMELYRKAAELGSREAMARIGALYYQGNGTEQSYEEALSWFQKAEQAGNTDVLFYIGSMYESGNGTSKNLEKAKAYYERAVDLGSEEAGERLITLNQLPEKQFLVGEWGETESIRSGTTKAYYLESPCIDCGGLTMSLRITSFTGYPFGEWYLYAKDMEGNWSHIAQFKIGKEQADGRETEYTFVFPSPQTFNALSICQAENGMEFELDRVIIFYL